MGLQILCGKGPRWLFWAGSPTARVKMVLFTSLLLILLRKADTIFVASTAEEKVQHSGLNTEQ
jgi:hypothetical protein